MSAGSSPLARGLLLPVWIAWDVDRIIPARAGFTSAAPSPGSIRRDHPRSRGVYDNETISSCHELGSSPLARGLPDAAVARAGWAEDHPRSRGVYIPPGVDCSGLVWIIPARAGFTRAGSRRVVGAWDHPRSRGVYDHGDGRVIAAGGSSPLARGLRLSACSITGI